MFAKSWGAIFVYVTYAACKLQKEKKSFDILIKIFITDCGEEVESYVIFYFAYVKICPNTD